MGDLERIRIVTLGGPRVGKSSIVKRFLFNTFTEKYKATVDDLFSKEFDFGSITLKVDILDTAGDLQFPAMRRLSIATAHAFLLVYAIDSKPSFEVVKGCFEEIQEQRADFQDIPIVIAGNKMDVELTKIDVEFDDVSDWISSHMPILKAKIMECSAKEGANVKEVFRSFLTLAKINVDQKPKDEISGFKRRLSAHAGSKSKHLSPSSKASTPNTQPSSPIFAKLTSGFNSPTSKGPGSPSARGSPQFLTPEDPCPLNRNKPRSRSLIRRCSKKVKKQVQDASEGQDGCLLC